MTAIESRQTEQLHHNFPPGTELGEELTDEDTVAITAFLESLTGKVPEVVYPILPPETAATPRPTGEVITK